MSSSAIAAGNVREHKAELNKSRGRETSSNQASQIWDIVYGVAMKMRKTQTVIPACAGIHRVSLTRHQSRWSDGDKPINLSGRRKPAGAGQT